MLQTIQTGSHISIQGEFVRAYADGSIMVRVGPSYYVGRPVRASGSQTQDETALSVASA